MTMSFVSRLSARALGSLVCMGTVGLALDCGSAPRTVEATSELDGYEHCNAVLEGDLFNKVNSKGVWVSSASNVYKRYVLSKSATEAYSLYQEAYREWKKAGGGGGFDFLGIISAEGSGSYARELSRSEFEIQFRRAQDENARILETSSISQTNIVSNYGAYVRDPETIRAWAACVTRDLQPGLYAFASRDRTGNPYVNVVWAPGNFAGIAPRIAVTFEKPPGMTIDDESQATVAVGTGRAFLVSYGQDQQGFNVAVNGTLTDPSGKILGSFTASCEMPPGQMPVLDRLPAVGTCSSDDVRILTDSYWYAFGRAADTNDVKAWCSGPPASLDRLISNHRGYLRDQGPHSHVVRDVVDRTYMVVLGRNPSEIEALGWVDAVATGQLFVDLATAHGAWAKAHGMSCTTVTWEHTTPSTVPFCHAQ